ncbi:MAG: D-sedoheptulose 7-phosphate isomerase [Gemmataceae bacterium]
MTPLDLIRKSIDDGIAVKRRMLDTQAGVIAATAERLAAVLKQGGTIYLCGNGGSAADAQHIAAEFVGRFLRERRPLPSVALSTNTSILTAIGNDYSFDQVFSRQVRACVTAKDAVCGISTSGKSPNVIEALKAAREIGALTVGWTGEPGEPLGSLCDLCLKVPTTATPRIQECHIVAGHIVCDLTARGSAE